MLIPGEGDTPDALMIWPIMYFLHNVSNYNKQQIKQDTLNKNGVSLN